MRFPLCHIGAPTVSYSIAQQKSCTHMLHKHASTALCIVFSMDTHSYFRVLVPL